MMKNELIKIAYFIFILSFFSACGDLDNSDYASIESGNLILTEKHGGNGSAWGFSSCRSCHLLDVIHESNNLIKNMVNAKGYNTCTGCHGTNGTDTKRECIICHNTLDMPNAPYMKGSFSHNFIKGSSNAISDENCIVCHEASDMNGNFDFNRDLSIYPDASGFNRPYTKEYDFCIRCHNRDQQQPGYEMTGSSYDDPLIAIEDDYTLIDSHGEINSVGSGTYAGLRTGYNYSTVVDCSDCHSLHGTKNDLLIIDSSQAGAKYLPEALRDTPYSANVTGGNYSQLCVLCHSMDTILDSGDVDTGNGLAGVHDVGVDCRPCHTHGEAVQSGL
ncbi:MAG: hypothetical protein OEV42_02200 [Deltaproteobacteria bacterium]|nr:hypothetical protein [Deltaproteobacteria bacterium]